MPSSRHLVQHLPDARLAVVEGAAHYPWFLQGNRIVAEVEEFLTGARSAATDRQLATLLFTDVVGSTERAVELGDRQWHDVLEKHPRLVAAYAVAEPAQ